MHCFLASFFLAFKISQIFALNQLNVCFSIQCMITRGFRILQLTLRVFSCRLHLQIRFDQTDPMPN